MMPGVGAGKRRAVAALALLLAGGGLALTSAPSTVATMPRLSGAAPLLPGDKR